MEQVREGGISREMRGIGDRYLGTGDIGLMEDLRPSIVIMIQASTTSKRK